VLRQHLGEAPGHPDVDRLYDSITIAHDTRWDLPLPPLDETLGYMDGVLQRVRDHLANDGPDPQRDYLTQYAVFHEDMHTEAFTYTRQTLGYPAPGIGAPLDAAWQAGRTRDGCRNSWRNVQSRGPTRGRFRLR
jgi:gamma-glutamyl hercynylcysteine S-oxide synthase